MPSSDGKCWLAVYDGKVDVTDFGADETGVADSAPAINAAAAYAQTAALDVYAPSGSYHVKTALTLGTTSSSAKSQCLRGDGWETIFDVSTDFSASAPGVIVPAVSAAPSNVQFCVRDVHVRFHQPVDLAVPTTAASAATTTTITVASAAGIVVGDYVYDATSSGAIVSNYPTTTIGGTTVAGVAGNVISLSQAIASPGVGSGDVIDFAQPRANFTTLSSGCSVTAGAPGCKYPWAVYNNGMQNFLLDHVMVEAAWDGIYQRGSTFAFNNLYVGALDQGLNEDASHNFPQLNTYEFWNGWGLATWSAAGPAFSQNFYDGNTVCANLGGDSISMGSVQCWTGKFNITGNWVRGQIDNLMLDGSYADFSFAPTSPTSWVEIANMYQTTGPNIEFIPETAVSNGKVYVGLYHVDSSQRRPIMAVTGGELHIKGGAINAALVGSQYAATVSAGVLDIRDTILDAPSGCAGNLAGWAQQSGSGVLQLTNDNFTNACVGLNGVVIGSDVLGTSIKNVNFNGWGLSGPNSFPSGPIGYYAATPRSVTSGSSDTQKLADTAIVWASASGVAKSENIYGCTANDAGVVLVVDDAEGDAAANPITIAPQGGTIANAATFRVSTNHGNVTLTCDGISNWIVSTQKTNVVTVTSAMSPFTYTPSPWAVTVDAFLYGAGGSGGGGALQATGLACSGGGGGGGGATNFGTFPVAALGASQTITVGAAPSGGPAATVNSSAGTAGTVVAQTTNFGSLLTAYFGGAGAGGQLAAASGGGGAGTSGSSGGAASGSTGGGAGFAGPAGASGAAGSNANGWTFGAAGAGSDAAGNSYAGGSSLFASAAGGSGGGITSANVANNGGNGGWSWKSTSFVTGGSGAGANGNSGAAANAFQSRAGSGGAGGAASLTAAFAGGNGGFPGGGGGGGGCGRNGGTAGAGGNGGAGLAILVERN